MTEKILKDSPAEDVSLEANKDRFQFKQGDPNQISWFQPFKEIKTLQNFVTKNILSPSYLLGIFGKTKMRSKLLLLKHVSTKG